MNDSRINASGTQDSAKDMQIRHMEYGDIMGVTEMHRKNFKDFWTYKMLADAFLDANFRGYIITDGQEVVATGAFTLAPEQADLLNVVVNERYRRQGIAVRMMKQILVDCRKIELKKLFLEVRKSNVAAIALYKRFRFKEISERKKYYNDGENAIVMVKEFKYKV